MTSSTTKAVENTLPRVLVVADRKVLVHVEGLVKRAQGFKGRVTPENLPQADAVLKEITAISKQIESDRKRVKEPVLALGKRIDSAAKEAGEPLQAARQELMGGIATCQRELEAKRREAEAAARRETARLEQVRQAAERSRQEAVRQQEAREAAILENARLEQVRKDQEAERQAALAANAEAEDGAEVVVPEPVPEPELVEVPEEVAVPEPVQEVTPVEVYVPPAVKTSVSRSQKPTLVIDDASLIPYQATEGGEPLTKPINAAITRALRAGLDVPGCRLEIRETLGSR